MQPPCALPWLFGVTLEVDFKAQHSDQVKELLKRSSV